MSTHNICFHGEIRKILSRYQPLSGAMKQNRAPDKWHIWVYNILITPKKHVGTHKTLLDMFFMDN